MVYPAICCGDLRSTMAEKVVSLERKLLFGPVLEIFTLFFSLFDLFWSFFLDYLIKKIQVIKLPQVSPS